VWASTGNIEGIIKALFCALLVYATTGYATVAHNIICRGQWVPTARLDRMYANCLEKALNNKNKMRVVLKAVADIQR
jgi:hypothetical protein